MWRSLVSLLCLTSLLACSQSATLSGSRPVTLADAREDGDGIVRLLDDQDEAVHLRPDNMLTLGRVDGESLRIEARRLCRSSEGVSLREPQGSCDGAQWWAAWDEVTQVQVEQFDGAATVGVTTVVAVIVVGVIVIALSSKSSSSGGGRGSSSSGSQGSATAVGGVSAGGAGRTAMRPPPPRYVHHHHHHHGSGGGLLILNLGSSGSVDASDEPAPPPDPALSSPSLAPQPLFSERAMRRAWVRPTLRLELTGCLIGGECGAGSGRAGVLLGELIEVSGGVRVDQTPEGTSVLGLFGLSMQGSFVQTPSLALALGTQVAVGDRTRLIGTFGLRWRAAGDLWLGLHPAAVTYLATEHRAAYSPSLDLGYEF